MVLQMVLFLLLAIQAHSAQVNYIINEKSKDAAIESIPLNVTHLTIRRVLDTIPDLTHLTSLVKVDFTENRISDPDVPLSELIPSSVIQLILKQNQLTTVPDISGLSKIQVFNLQANQIMGHEKPLAQLLPASLEDVNFADNPFKTMPEFPDISFPNLKEIKLFYMSEMEIPFDTFSKHLAISLEKLVFSSNALSSIPDLRRLKNLKELHMDRCSIHSPPTLKLVLPLSVQKLNLNSNVLNQFPDTRGLPRLMYVDLSYNRIVGAPTENKVDSDNQIEELLMDENSLTALPDLCIFPKLKKLSLYANKIRIIGQDRTCLNQRSVKINLWENPVPCSADICVFYHPVRDLQWKVGVNCRDDWSNMVAEDFVRLGCK